MIKVVHLARSFWPNVGGVETHLLHLTQLLSKRQIEQTVIVERSQFNHEVRETINKVQIIRLDTLNNQSGWSYKIKLWTQLNNYLSILLRADIVHVHDVFWWLIPFWPLLVLKRKKVYITFHGYEGDEAPNWRKIMWHWLAAKATKGSIGVGGFHRRWYKINPTYTIFGAVAGQGKKVAKKINKLKGKPLSIIHVGRLAHDNGILEYLQAIKLLQAENFLVHLESFGDGPLKESCEKFVSQHNLNVIFHGSTDHQQINYSKYDLAFVSRYLSILEAMLAGLPIIAQYNNQIKYDYLYLSPFAKWINIETEPQIIAQIVKSNPKLSSSAQKWAQTQTWEELVSVYINLWQIKK